MVAVQRFRSDLGLYVHLHCLVTDGVFEDLGEALRFLPADPPTPARMTAVLAQVHAAVLAAHADDDLDMDPTLRACVQRSFAGPHLYDVHEHDGQLYLAMEFAQGERAGNFVQQPLCPAHVLAVGIQLADALAALHSLGVAHRDIHGSNVLIDFAAGPVTRPIVRLLDLGMCDLLPAWFARVHRYGTPPEHRVALGTGGLEQFAWTAPEARRERVWTEKCDVWSTGLLLFQLFTGHRPSPAGSDEPPISPSTWVSCSNELAHTLLAALHPDPSHRLDAPGLLARLTETAELQVAEDGVPELQ